MLVKGVVGMRILLISCLITILNLGVVGNAPQLKALSHLSQDNQSQDISLLKPTDIAYADAMEFARFLNDKGFNVKSVHRSKLEGFLRGDGKAAFFRTEKGIVEVIFFPDPTGADKVRVTEQRQAGRYLYSFEGQPHPNPPGDTFDSNRPMYFLMYRNWLIVPDGKEFYDALKVALKEG
jgi:hypothetical protein